MIAKSLTNSVYGLLGLSVLLVSVIPNLAAAAPNVNTITVQGYMQKPAGAGAVTNGTYQIAYGICAPDCTATGNVLWVQKINTPVTNGLFSVNLTGAGQNLSADATVAVGSNLRVDRSSATLTPALIRDISSGAVTVRAYAASTIDGGNPQFDIVMGSVPTAFVAGSVVPGSIRAAALDNPTGVPQVIPSEWRIDASQLTGTSTDPVTIGNGATAGAVTIGGSSGSQAVTIGGSGNAASATSISGGSTGGVNINDNVNSPTNINTGTSTGTVNISTGASAGALNLGTGTGSGAVNIATGTSTAGKTVTIGNGTHASNVINVVGGTTGGININASNGAAPTNINTGTSTGAVNIGGASSGIVSINNGTGSGAVNIGTAATTAQTITVGGSGNAGNTVAINAGSTNGVRINNDTNSPTNINTGTSTGAVNIGTGTAAGAITIGGGGTGAINIGNSSTSGTRTITIGNTTNAGNVLALRGGSTGGITFNAGSAFPRPIAGGSTAVTNAASTTVTGLTGVTTANFCIATVNGSAITTPPGTFPLRATAGAGQCVVTWSATITANGGATVACLCF